MFGQSFNLSHIDSSSQIYGPGNRYVVWLQGCTLACKGCWNTAMWHNKPKMLIDREALLKQIINAEGITGVTFLGGEPLQQIDNLIWLCKALKKYSLSIMLYTGYELHEIESGDRLCEAVELVDILISGRYIDSQRDRNLLWRGSRNQKITFISTHYQDISIEECNQVEITIDSSGQLTVLGYPDDELLKGL